MYYLSSFFNQFGPNCITFLVAAEVYPVSQLWCKLRIQGLSETRANLNRRQRHPFARPHTDFLQPAGKWEPWLSPS